MRSTSEVIAQILALREEKANISKALKQKNQEETALLASLQHRIRTGESTGDRITDFVIACYGIPGDKAENAYRELETRLKGYVGEVVLTVHSRVAQDRNFGESHGAIPRFRTSYLERTFWLGVLTNDTPYFKNDTRRSYLPTHAGHAICPNLCFEQVESESGDIPLDDLLSGLAVPLHLNTPLDTSNVYPSLRPKKTVYALEVIVGNDAVGNWFEEEGAHALLLFREALRLLGRKAPESALLGEEIRRRTDGILEALSKLVAERDSLKRKLGRISASKASGTYSPDGLSITVCENADDAFFIGLGPRERLKEVEDELKRRLAAACEKGFAPRQHPLIQQLCTEYAVALPAD